jgi:hypothetical protein
MITNKTVFEISKDLTLGVKPTELEYAGYRLVSNLMHCGVGGKIWVTTIVSKHGECLSSFMDDSFCATKNEAIKFIEKRI